MAATPSPPTSAGSAHSRRGPASAPAAPSRGDPAVTPGLLPPPILTPGLKPRPPSVELFQTCDDSGLVSLLCLASGFAPPPVGVAWLKDGAELEPGRAHHDSPAPGRAESRLNVSMAEWRDATFACRVSHAPSGAALEAPARRCSAPLSTPISVFTLPPSPSDLYVTQAPRILCVAANLPSDEGLQVTWSRPGGGAVAQPLPLKLQHHFNGTFTATSALPVATKEWEEGVAYECHVTHAELPAAIDRRAQRRQGKRLAPSVYVFPPPAEELAGSRPTLSLTCLARGFFPETLDLHWQRNQEALPASGGLASASTGSPQREGGADGAYFLYSRLQVARSDWEGGASFTCTVVHEGLALRFVQRSLRKSPGLVLPPDFCPEEPGGDPWDALGVLVTLFLLSVGYGATVTLCKVQWVLSSLVRLSVQQGA